jgi:hypothetical protein
MTKNGTKDGSGANSGTTEKTYRELFDARQALLDLVKLHPEVFEAFGRLSDDFNKRLANHKAALKANRSESPFFTMSIPHPFVVKDIELAKQTLGARFDEFVETKHDAKTDIVRNALKSGTCPGLEMVVEEIEGSPRHTGLKEINISALLEKQ